MTNRNRKKISPGRLQLLRSASPDGYVFASDPGRVRLADTMVKEGLLKHHRGLIYEVTQKGLARV